LIPLQASFETVLRWQSDEPQGGAGLETLRL